MTDSGGAGKFRGGSGTAWEVEPLDKEMLCIGFGEGRRTPAMGAAGARSTMIDEKVGRVELNRGGNVQVARTNILETIKPGETITNMNPGGSPRSTRCGKAASQPTPPCALWSTRTTTRA
jgi:N-methylhydantoinase B